MFIHSFVVLPVPVTAEMRQAFYLLFTLNIPEQVQDFVNGIRFGFLAELRWLKAAKRSPIPIQGNKRKPMN